MSFAAPRFVPGARGTGPYLFDGHARWGVSVLNAAWLSVGAGVVLSLIGVYAIDVALRTGDEAFAGRALKQLIFLGMGVLAAGVIALPHYRLYGVLAWPAMVLSIGLLIFLLLPFVPETIVKPENGARAWINLRIVKLQPSELAKIAFVLVVAHWLRFRTSHRKFPGLVPIAAIAAVPLGLITLQPDLGTVLTFIPALFAMLVAAGARLRHLVIIVLAATLAAPAMYPLLKPHQKVRIQALVKQVQGDRDGAQDINYQSFTAQKLVGAGGLFGNDDGHARALVEFNRLPERHNDMVFAVIVTRFGLFGGLFVLLMYLVWIAGAILTAANCKDPFGRLVAVGLAGFIAAQVMVNIGMNIGLVPIIGVTLPFVSYGGSSLITLWMTTGLLVNIAMRRPLPPFRSSFEYADDDE
ncbi:MAG: FtsW/RodA/SpoVE family cell cycle protein [Phycisphaerales bacterium]